MIKFMTVQLEKYGTSMACFEGLPEEILFYFKNKNTWQHSLGLQSCIWTNHKTSRTMSFEQMRPKLRCLAIKSSAMFGENLKSTSAKPFLMEHSFGHSIPKVTHAGGGLMIWGLFISHRTWEPHSHWVDHEVLCIPKYSRVKCEDMCPTAKVGLKLGHATGQWSQGHQQIYNRKAEKNQGAATFQSKCRPHPDWNALARAVHKQMPTNLDKLEQCCKEEWAKIPPDRCERPIKSDRKLLFQVVAAKSGSTGNWTIGCPNFVTHGFFILALFLLN